MNASNLDAISRFRDAYFQVQKIQTEKLQTILNDTLSALYKNSYLPKDQNQTLIETESMRMNEANMSNTRYVSRLGCPQGCENYFESADNLKTEWS